MLMPATGTELRGSVPMNTIGDIEFSSEHHLFMPVVHNPSFVLDLDPSLIKRIAVRPSFLSKAVELDDNTYVIRDKAGNEQMRTLSQEYGSWNIRKSSSTEGEKVLEVVKFALKSKPNVKAYITLWTHEGWKYTMIKVGPEQQEVSPGYGCSFYIEDWAPRAGEDEKFDATSIEIDPASDPDDNFHYYDWNNQYSPRLVVYRSNAAPGDYTLRFRLKSNHDISCTMKITITPEE